MFGCEPKDPPGAHGAAPTSARSAAPAASQGEQAPASPTDDRAGAADATRDAEDSATSPRPTDKPSPDDGVPAEARDAAADTGSLAATDADQPQTRDKPSPDDPLTQRRAKALFEAMVADTPDTALDFFFPLGAYRQVKDVGNPERDWRARLVRAYERDLHEIHAARRWSVVPAGAGADAARVPPRFVALEIPAAAVRWVEPGEEYNKIGYYRVFGSKLVGERADGSRLEIPLKSLISWRGAWYLVHLSSFK